MSKTRVLGILLLAVAIVVVTVLAERKYATIHTMLGEVYVPIFSEAWEKGEKVTWNGYTFWKGGGELAFYGKEAGFYPGPPLCVFQIALPNEMPKEAIEWLTEATSFLHSPTYIPLPDPRSHEVKDGHWTIFYDCEAGNPLVGLSEKWDEPVKVRVYIDKSTDEDDAGNLLIVSRTLVELELAGVHYSARDAEPPFLSQ